MRTQNRQAYHPKTRSLDLVFEKILPDWDSASRSVNAGRVYPEVLLNGWAPRGFKLRHVGGSMRFLGGTPSQICSPVGIPETRGIYKQNVGKSSPESGFAFAIQILLACVEGSVRWYRGYTHV